MSSTRACPVCSTAPPSWTCRRSPELFITQDPLPNAMTLGSDKPFIVITTTWWTFLDAEEHRYVIGHELGHVLSGHAVYRTMSCTS